MAMQAQIAALAQSLSERVRLPWDFAVIEPECPHCGGAVPLLRRTCPDCGGDTKLGGSSISIAIALMLLVAAGATVATVLLRWQQLDAATATGLPADALIAPTSTTDFSWVRKAMSGCDAVASADPSPLHFLVTPLVPVGTDTEPWRAKSINAKGDGILLRADDAIDGLKQGTLRIFPGDYVFSLTDEASLKVLRWRAAVGVARFSNANATSVASFTVQFRTAHGTNPVWDTTFNRQNGSCAWVNPIIGG
jgi:hypothetical protein